MSTQDIVADAKPQVLPAHSMRRYPLFIGAGPFVIALVLWIVVGWFDPLSLRYVIPKAGEVAAMLVGMLVHRLIVQPPAMHAGSGLAAAR